METASCKLNAIAKTWKQLILFKMVYNIFKFLHLASMVQYKIDMKTDKLHMKNLINLHMHNTLF